MSQISPESAPQRAMHYVLPRAVVAAGTAALAYIAVPSAVEAFRPLSGGTKDLAACSNSLHLDTVTDFAAVPTSCKPWEDAVTFVHKGEDYKLIPTKGATTKKKTITEPGADYWIFPKQSDFTHMNTLGAQAADSAREAKVSSLQAHTAEGVGVGTFVLLLAASGLKRARGNGPKPPKIAATTSGGDKPASKEPRKQPSAPPFGETTYSDQSPTVSYGRRAAS